MRNVANFGIKLLPVTQQVWLCNGKAFNISFLNNHNYRFFPKVTQKKTAQIKLPVKFQEFPCLWLGSYAGGSEVWLFRDKKTPSNFITPTVNAQITSKQQESSAPLVLAAPGSWDDHNPSERREKSQPSLAPNASDPGEPWPRCVHLWFPPFRILLSVFLVIKAAKINLTMTFFPV